MRGEEEIRLLAASFLAGRAEAADEQLLLAEPELAAELERRLDACGVRLVREAGEAPLCVVEVDNDDLSELALACLARIAVSVQKPQAGRRARLDVRELWEEVGKPNGYTEAYVRRAGLGPLEQRKLVHVVKPEQAEEGPYVVAGPALRAIDGAHVARLLARLSDAA
jgi:hypothetical protein